MSFLTETDDSKYKVEKKSMLKQEAVVSIEGLITPEGRLTLTTEQVD